MTRVQLAVCQALLLSGLTVLAYSEVRHHHFVWDTIPFVLENPWVHEWTRANVIAMFTEAHRSNWHPVVLLSHALDIALFGYDSGAHHLVNLALHCINALLLFCCTTLLLTGHGMPAGRALWTGCLTAGIFAVHPQHVESVAWVVERKDVLYALFTLCCLISYLLVGRRRDAHWCYNLVPFGFFCLAIGTKAMAVTLPLVLLMLDLVPLRRLTLATWRRCCLEKAHYIVVAMAVALITLRTQAGAMADIISLPVWARSLNAIDNSWFYVAHYLWPLDLSPFYPYPQDASQLASPAFWLPGAILLATGTGLSGYLARRQIYWPGLLFCFYLVTLLPVSGLIHVGPAKATDHYVYLATIPFSLLTALAIVWLFPKKRLKLLVTPMAVSYLVFLLLVTQVQVMVWRDPLSLWTRVTTLYPESPFGHRNIAAVYQTMGEWELAIEHAERSLVLGSPDHEFVERLRAQVALIREAGG